MAGRGGDDGGLAAQVWRALYDFCRSEYERHLVSAAELEITPGDLKALLWLVPGQPQPMRTLADRWGSDASTVTWIIDRLEERGLVERRANATDRRIRAVQLTEYGEKVRAELLGQLYRPPAAFADLSNAELQALRHLVAKLGQ